MKVLVSTIWYSQIDEQFERTNQIIEIALRYFIIANSKANWIYVLSYLVGNLNNFKNQSTEVSSNKILYEFNVRDTLELLIELSKKDFNRLRQLKREQVEEFIAFVNIMIKIYYDESHMSISLLKESKTYLRLYHNYKIPELVNYKLHNQRVEPFKILEKVSKLAYRLKLPPLMKIYSVIFIAQLKSGKDENPYTRNQVIAMSEIEKDDIITNIFEIETLLGKQVSRDKTQYLIKWKNCGNEHNVWYDVDDLKNAMELIEEYETRQRERSLRSFKRSRQKKQKA